MIPNKSPKIKAEVQMLLFWMSNKHSTIVQIVFTRIRRDESKWNSLERAKVMWERKERAREEREREPRALVRWTSRQRSSRAAIPSKAAQHGNVDDSRKSPQFRRNMVRENNQLPADLQLFSMIVCQYQLFPKSTCQFRMFQYTCSISFALSKTKMKVI